jgi:hypothetical protein
MKKHWLRGLLLGVSMALLLGGAVAVAQGLTVTLDQACFECWPGPWGPEAEQDPTAEYVLEVEASGLNSDYAVCGAGYFPGYGWEEECFDLAPGTESILFSLAGSCETGELCIWLGQLQGMPSVCFDAEFGELRVRFWQEDDGEEVVSPVRAYATYAEVCEEEVEEFVPEPGSVILLGSGLAGLAGYASLRWRTKG